MGTGAKAPVPVFLDGPESTAAVGSAARVFPQIDKTATEQVFLKLTKAFDLAEAEEKIKEGVPLRAPNF
jgi:hypothetical protein